MEHNIVQCCLLRLPSAYEYMTVKKTSAEDVLLSTSVVDQSEVRNRLAIILKGVIQEMTSCPGDLQVSFTVGDKTTIYKVDLPQEFRGKLIGAQGKNITALRNIIAAMGGNHGFRAIIELVV